MASQDQLQKFEEFFDDADIDGNGWLSQDEFAMALRRGGFDDKRISEIFCELDKDNDKRITKQEYLNELMKLPPPQIDEARLRKAFMVIDQDGSGKLDINELKQVMINAGKNIEDESLRRTIALCDKDGDGEINFEEFLAAFHS